MQQEIIDFFDRFKGEVTQSIYEITGINDYQKLKTFFDYLDYDGSTIYRNKNQMKPCGLKNIGNTCYLNVFLQILYHINFLRQKIFSVEVKNSKFLQQLKFLFARMQVGKLKFADPVNLFDELKKSHPNVFIDGIQNDFNQISTLLFDQLKQSLNVVSQADSKMIEKILFGKLCIKTNHQEGKITKNTKFNIINLDVKKETLQKAIQQWKNYEIDDYLTQNNKYVKAKVQTDFIETPAMMTFCINRVTYKDNALTKDNRQFQFPTFLNLKKIFVGAKNEQNRQSKSPINKQIELEAQKDSINKWIKKISENKDTILKTLKYLQQKEFADIHLPQIQNKFQQNSKIKDYLQEQIKQIEAKVEQAKKEISKIQTEFGQLIQQAESQLYHLWGMMVHEGKSPTSGHYKVIFNMQGNRWTEFNDRNVYQITEEKLNSYIQKGQICSLFYRRPSLICNDKKVIIPLSLKTKVNEIEKQIFIQIDKVRLLQHLHQIIQSSGYLAVKEINEKEKNKWFYFFKPVMHCFEANSSLLQCQAVLAYQSLKDENQINKLVNLFLVHNQLKIPQLKFQFPQEYFKYSDIFKVFIKKQIQIELIQNAYEWLSKCIQTLCKNKIVNGWLQKYLELILMKGVFYLCVLYRLTINPLIQEKFSKLLSAIQKIFKRLNISSEFTLTYVVIKDEISKRFSQKSKKKKKENENEKTKILKTNSNKNVTRLLSESYCQIFKERFGYWIQLRQNLEKIDQEIIDIERDLHHQYILELS